MDMKEINRKVIEQFRAGGPVEGMDRDRLLLLTTTGRVFLVDHEAKTSRTIPVVALTRV